MRALVVDDEPSLVRVVGGYFEREGFSVRSAGDGESALELAREAEPDVVVLDLGLPVIDGVETCRRLRTFTDCYVVMLTARADEVDMLIGLAVGADDYLTKPFSPRELTARIRTLLRRPHGRPAADASLPVIASPPSLRVFGDLAPGHGPCSPAGN
jgi:DNA-binding response OmpR family regulator